jgi:uncharacterized protein (TIGR03435 family)
MKALLIIGLLAMAQAQPAFEVASVKRGNPDSGMRGSCHGIDSVFEPSEVGTAPPLGRCVITNARLGHMLFIAYHLRSMALITGGPGWMKMGDDRFNLEAKVEDPTKVTEEQLYLMLQALITERFNLKFRRETKDMPGYALVVGKKPKLRDAKGEEGAAQWSKGKPQQGQMNTLTARNYSMAKLADMLTLFGEPVIDKTGLTGTYDFTLSFDDTNGPSLTTALQEQLGLKFEAQKVPVGVIVVESAQKPSEN